eukprot:1395460-Amorphochlora_amoeboformis.AAC.2
MYSQSTKNEQEDLGISDREKDKVEGNPWSQGRDYGMSDEGGFQNETFSNLADLHSLSRPSLLPSNSFCSGPLSMFQLGGLGLPKSSGTFKPYEPSLHKSKSRGQITDSHSGGKRRKSEHAESLKDDQNFLSSLNRDTSNTLPLSPPLSPTSMFLGPRSDSVITLRDDELSEAEEYLPSMHPQPE